MGPRLPLGAGTQDSDPPSEDRGEVLEAQGKEDRFVLMQQFREQQELVDADNALSAIERAKERVAAATESVRLAKTLEEGERFRFSPGATSVLFVNLQERNSVDSESQVIRAKADYQKAQALYQWAIEAWVRTTPFATPSGIARETDREEVVFLSVL